MTDILGTIGPACRDGNTLRRMFEAGMTGIRINLSHTMLADNAEILESIKRSADNAGIKPMLLIDLQGPELRIGKLQENLDLKNGDKLFLKPDSSIKAEKKASFFDNTCITDETDMGKIPENGSRPVMIDDRIFSEMSQGDEVLLDDGKILCTVSSVSSGYASLTVKRGGVLKSRKSILIKGKSIPMPTLTKEDIINIGDAVIMGITGVMLPFVRSREDIIALREALENAGGNDISIYAKIENMAGVDMLSDLIDECDEIVIARGDLGNAMPLWELPGVQKRIAKLCNEKRRRFMVVTQMLSSMENNPVPTRAEVSDIFNAVLDGASSVMVTGETAVGRYPTEVIEYLSRTVLEAEHFKM